MYKHILIATDGSDLAEKAVVHGVELAKAVGAKTSAIVVEHTFNVFDVPQNRIREMPDVFREHAEQIKKHAAKVLDHVASIAKARGVPFVGVQKESDQPYEPIIETAKENGCDLIVMASHGRGGLSAVLIGSVTHKVLTHTDIPVLVYR
ncbi:MAG: universal stress protein [Alphaproteobacteria bacterium]|nr:universal stress protein [Alphaproteobacteria bacterium]